ncbi:hypothetical protein B566_EDAN014749 [Ephemera danica]|nr:hypothetical protein B566_EDAN014749 [Ephemera danica]
MTNCLTEAHINCTAQHRLSRNYNTCLSLASRDAPYTGSYEVLSRNDKTFKILVNSKDEVFSIDRPKPAYILDVAKLSKTETSNTSDTERVVAGGVFLFHAKHDARSPASQHTSGLDLCSIKTAGLRVLLHCSSIPEGSRFLTNHILPCTLRPIASFFCLLCSKEIETDPSSRGRREKVRDTQEVEYDNKERQSQKAETVRDSKYNRDTQEAETDSRAKDS